MRQTFAEVQIPDAMAKPLAATFEAGDWPHREPLGKLVCSPDVFQLLYVGKDGQHVVRIWLPVGGQPQIATRLQCTHEQLDELRLNQAPLVMTFLGPWVRKEDMDAREASFGELIREYLDRVVRDDLEIGQLLCLRGEEQMANACTMHFHTDAVDLRMRAGKRCERIAGAETDFEQAGFMPAEQRIQVEWHSRIIDAEDGPQLDQGPFLCGGHAAGAQDETAYATATVPGRAWRGIGRTQRGRLSRKGTRGCISASEKARLLAVQCTSRQRSDLRRCGGIETEFLADEPGRGGEGAGSSTVPARIELVGVTDGRDHEHDMAPHVEHGGGERIDALGHVTADPREATPFAYALQVLLKLKQIERLVVGARWGFLAVFQFPLVLCNCCIAIREEDPTGGGINGGDLDTEPGRQGANRPAVVHHHHDGPVFHPDGRIHAGIQHFRQLAGFLEHDVVLVHAPEGTGPEGQCGRPQIVFTACPFLRDEPMALQAGEIAMHVARQHAETGRKRAQGHLAVEGRNGFQDMARRFRGLDASLRPLTLRGASLPVLSTFRHRPEAFTRLLQREHFSYSTRDFPIATSRHSRPRPLPHGQAAAAEDPKDMRDFTVENLTDAVIESYSKGTTDPRLKVIFTSLIKHLHGFVKDVQLTEGEWFEAIKFLTATGQKCDDKRQEFILLSDVLGASMLVDAINHNRRGQATENTVLGPFYVPGSPELPMGANLIRRDIGGEPILVRGTVTDPSGKPIVGAIIDTWEAADNGLYHMQDSGAPEFNLCGRFKTGADGKYWFITEKPAAYPIPTDGPVGALLKAAGRGAYRPAHIHFILKAEGYDQLTTHIFIAGDPQLEKDPVFGTKASLVGKVEKSSDAGLAQQVGLKAPFSVINFDFGLMPLPKKSAA